MAHAERWFVHSVDRAVSGAPLHDQRRRGGYMRYYGRGHGDLEGAAAGDFLRFAGRRGREDLSAERDRRIVRIACGPESGGARQERTTWAVSGVARDFGRDDSPARGWNVVRDCGIDALSIVIVSCVGR